MAVPISVTTPASVVRLSSLEPVGSSVEQSLDRRHITGGRLNCLLRQVPSRLEEWERVEFPGQGDPVIEDVRGVLPDLPGGAEHSVEEEQHQGDNPEQQDCVADPPPDHRISLLGSPWVRSPGRTGFYTVCAVFICSRP